MTGKIVKRHEIVVRQFPLFATQNAMIAGAICHMSQVCRLDMFGNMMWGCLEQHALNTEDIILFPGCFKLLFFSRYPLFTIKASSPQLYRHSNK